LWENSKVAILAGFPVQKIQKKKKKLYFRPTTES